VLVCSETPPIARILPSGRSVRFRKPVSGPKSVSTYPPVPKLVSSVPFLVSRASPKRMVKLAESPMRTAADATNFPVEGSWIRSPMSASKDPGHLSLTRPPLPKVGSRSPGRHATSSTAAIASTASRRARLMVVPFPRG